MKLSKNGIKVLAAQYRAVLRKCLLINMGVVLFSANAVAMVVYDGEDVKHAGSIDDDVTFKGIVTIDGQQITSNNHDFIFEKATATIKDTDLETDRDKKSPDYDVDNPKGSIYINESDLTITCPGGECTPDYDKNGFLGFNVIVDGSIISMGEAKSNVDNSYIGANHNFEIKNDSEVTLNGLSVLAYEGSIDDDDGGKGKFLISDSDITLNDNSALKIGEADNVAEATLEISNGSQIILNDYSSIEFVGFNQADTEIKESTIIMNGHSSMKLNDLILTAAEINMKDYSKVEFTNVSLDSESKIKGNKNEVSFKGKVDFAGFFDPATANVDGNLTRSGFDDEITYNLNSGTLKYNNDEYLYDSGKHTHAAGENGRDTSTNAFADGQYALNTLNFNGGTLDIANGKASDIKLAKLSLSEESNIILDADLANQTMDRFSDDTTVDGSAKLNISKLNLVSDAQNEKTTISFTKDATLLAATNYTGATSGLRALSPIYTYDVAYENGDFTFTRGGGSSVSDYNPAVYAGSVVGQTLATIQSTIAQTAFSSLNNTLPQKDNAWVSVIGFDDTVDMKSFKNVDSEMYSVVGGVNSDAKHFDNFDATYGLYAGYINSEQKYDGNKIEQNGGYIGLDSVLTKGSAELLAGINTGYIRNEDKHSFGNDKFDTYFTGVAVKAGYTYDLNNGLSVVPNLYAGYTFVNNEDYTSKSGVKIKNDNLHLFEVAPGVKVNKDFNNGWTGYAQAKYAFITDNGGDADVNNINLPNISAKDYVEYGLGANKALNDSWSLSAEINRRDGGREGWNGNLNVKYNF